MMEGLCRSDLGCASWCSVGADPAFVKEGRDKGGGKERIHKDRRSLARLHLESYREDYLWLLGWSLLDQFPEPYHADPGFLPSQPAFWRHILGVQETSGARAR